MGDAMDLQMRTLKVIVASSEKHEGLDEAIANRLFMARAYGANDAALQEKVKAIMAKANQAERWETFSKAARGDRRALNSVLYQYCANYPQVVELIREIGVGFTDFTPVPEGMTLDTAREALTCEYMKDWLVTLTIQSLDQAHSAEAFQILDDRQLKIISHAIYARRGKAVTDKELVDFFATQYWYKPDEAYADSKLTDADKANLEHIQAEMAKRSG